jgi:Zn-dependent protease with chaperone function
VKFLFSAALLGLAWFAAVNLAASVAAWLLAPAMVRRGCWSARTLITFRLLPAVTSLVFVVAFFLPSHWQFEPQASDETFGVVVGALSALGFGLLAGSAWRVVWISWCDYRLAALTRRAAAPFDTRAVEIRDLGGISLAGVFRPRILVGSETRAELTAAELDVAICHEIAHQRSRDNLKRFLIYCAPDLFGWSVAARGLEQRWQAEAECEADAHAVSGDHRRAVLLASALVKVARVRWSTNAIVPSPMWSPFHVPALLETRVRRLIAGPTAGPSGEARLRPALAFAALAGAASAWMLDVSYSLHVVTELLVMNLP